MTILHIQDPRLGVGQKWFHLVISSRGNDRKTFMIIPRNQLTISIKNILNPLPMLTDKEKHSIASSFGSSSQYQCVETNTKRILTDVLKRWNENKSSAHTRTCALTPYETVAMKIYSIEIK